MIIKSFAGAALAIAFLLLPVAGVSAAGVSDLFLRKTSDIDPDIGIAKGERITFTVVYRNNGPDPATGTMIEDFYSTVPYYEEYWLPPECEDTGRKIRCTIGYLEPGIDLSLSYSAKIRFGADEGYTNSLAHIYSDNTDPDISDNNDSVRFSIVDQFEDDVYMRRSRSQYFAELEAESAASTGSDYPTGDGVTSYIAEAEPVVVEAEHAVSSENVESDLTQQVTLPTELVTEVAEGEDSTEAEAGIVNGPAPPPGTDTESTGLTGDADELRNTGINNNFSPQDEMIDPGDYLPEGYVAPSDIPPPSVPLPAQTADSGPAAWVAAVFSLALAGVVSAIRLRRSV